MQPVQCPFHLVRLEKRCRRVAIVTRVAAVEKVNKKLSGRCPRSSGDHQRTCAAKEISAEVADDSQRIHVAASLTGRLQKACVRLASL